MKNVHSYPRSTQCMVYFGVSKNRGTPKWMVKIMEKPIKMDDLGVPLFLETPIYLHVVVFFIFFYGVGNIWLEGCLNHGSQWVNCKQSTHFYEESLVNFHSQLLQCFGRTQDGSFMLKYLKMGFVDTVSKSYFDGLSVVTNQTATSSKIRRFAQRHLKPQTGGETTRAVTSSPWLLAVYRGLYYPVIYPPWN